MRDGGVLDGLPMRDPISAEKMAGLYVDFDETTACFVRPSETMLVEEAVQPTLILYTMAYTDG